MRRWSVLAAAALSLAAVPQAELPAKITAVSPNLVRRGVPTDVTITGERLAAVTRLHWTGDGKIAAEFPADRKAEPARLVVRVTASADASLGERELRAISPGGVSNPLPFAVGLLPVVLEKEPNNSLDAAQKLELPAAVLGAVHAAAETDLFRFTARKGSRLVLNAHAFRLGSKLDAALALTDAAGRELARDNDTFGLDPFMELTVPEDGEYGVAIRDALYRGAGDYSYQLEIGEIPFLEGLFPLGGRRGTPVEAALIGRNFPPDAKVRLDLAPDAPLGRREVRADTSFGPSNPRPFEVGDLPEVLEPDPKEILSVPVVINGRIGKPGESDTYRFNAGEHTQLVVEVVANRLGSPLDGFLTLSDAQGKVVARNDDSGGADPKIDYKSFAKGAEYVVGLRDLVNRGGGTFAYRLRIAPPREQEPGFTLRFQPDAARVGRGSHGRLWCEVVRQAGYANEITVELADLPPGVTCEPVRIAGKTTTSWLAVTAASDAPTGAFPVRLIGRGAFGPKTIERAGDPELENRVVRQAFLSVLDAPPFTLDAAGAPTEEGRKKQEDDLAEVERTLAAPKPGLEDGLPAWEEKARSAWVTLKAETLTSSGGATFAFQEDGSYLVGGENPATDVFVFETAAAPKGIRAFRLEILPDPSLPAAGPGRAGNGNIVLTEFKVRVYGADGQRTPVELADPTADFSQDGWPIAASVDANPETGWAVSPEFGKPHAALFRTSAPLEIGARLQVKLEHTSVHAQHVIGRFRLSATSAADAAGGDLPADVRTILDTPAANRTDAQKSRLLDHYRTVAPELEELRRRAELLRTRTSGFPPRAARGGTATVGFVVRRAEGFAGDVTVSIEGFTAGRDEKTKGPRAFADSADVKPVVLKAGQEGGTISFKPKANCEIGTRMILLRGEAKVGDVPAVQYSRAIPLTVIEKAKP